MQGSISPGSTTSEDAPITHTLFDHIVAFIKDLYKETEGLIPLHAPVFSGREKEYLVDCIDSTFVSSVGRYVDFFEQKIEEYTGAQHAIATVNGTAALHLALLLAGVKPGDLVITQAVSFVATANAIYYCGAEPVFLDSDRETLGLSPDSVEAFLVQHCTSAGDSEICEKKTGRRIAACVPMHALGHPVRIQKIVDLCDKYRIPVVEDAAESIGSLYKGRHTGTFGMLGILSFNGNKTITTGGGGMILTNDEVIGKKAKHLSTTAKVPHPWEFVHDEVGFNYRLPNINAALGCAQMEHLPGFLEKKRRITEQYQAFFNSMGIPFMTEPVGCKSNYWLNALLLEDREARDAFLEYAHSHSVQCRPLWRLLSGLDKFSHCRNDSLNNARWLEDRLVCIPSSVTGM